MTFDPASLTYDERGLVPVVAQDISSGAVLMLAWANREALEETLRTGEAHFWSRSRRALWRKGETSGNRLAVESAAADCDADAVLLRVRASGPACHRGTRTCFESLPASLELGWLAAVIEARRGVPPRSSYAARLLAEGVDRAAQKVGEEAVETVIAALRPESADADSEERRALVGEAADLLFHLLVLLASRGVEPREVAAELDRRHLAAAGAQ